MAATARPDGRATEGGRLRWSLSYRAEPHAAQIADRHYNRRSVGAPQFVPPGRCVVLSHELALWVTSWPRAEYTKHAWAGAWVNSTFRNEGAGLSSELIREACAATRSEWGEAPAPHGIITFVDASKVRHKRDPGRCYLKAGWERIGTTVGGHGRSPLIVFGLRPDQFPPPVRTFGRAVRFARSGCRVLKAPFPWFGGKSRAAHLVWRGFGDVPNYVEPFAGSLAVLLGRPHEARIETVNDLDCYLANFWRAVKWAPELVAEHADWPVNEADLHARHRDLVTRIEFRRRMKREPRFFDAEIAGWWVWGLCQWIGGRWCSASNWDTHRRQIATAEVEGLPHLLRGKGVHGGRTHGSVDWEGRGGSYRQPRGIQLAEKRERDLSGSAEWEKRPALGKGARGVGRATTTLWEQLPDISGSRGAAGRGIHGSGVHEKLPKMDRGTASRLQSTSGLVAWMMDLAHRLRRTRVCCGDWKRVLGRSPTENIGVTAVMLDPPYSAEATRDPSLYAVESATVAHDVRKWALANGANPKLRIALCGYEGEHDMPPTWECVAWKAAGGYAASAGNTENSNRERIWFSPNCELVERQGDLFATTGRVA